MKTYKMTEKQNLNSQRESVEFKAKDLAQAKRKASLKQVFHGTVIELEDNLGCTLAVKESTGKWINQSYFA